MRKSIKQIKKNKTITFLNSRRRDGRTSTEEIAWPDVILLADGTAATRTPGWKEIKNAKQNEARCFSFDLARRVQSRKVKREGRMVLIQLEKNDNKFKRINTNLKLKTDLECQNCAIT